MPTEFTAAPQVLGYLYQVRYALLMLLEAPRDDVRVSLERLDDIDITNSRGQLTLAQLKHHITRAADLTDTSRDLWKTIRVWSEGLLAGEWDPNDTILQLVTTSTAPENSAAYFLRSGRGRSIDTAHTRLIAAATRSRSTDPAMQNAFRAFLSLSEPAQISLLGAVHVLDASPDISELEAAIRQQLLHASPPEQAQRDRMYHEVEGWWFGVAVEHLVGRSVQPIAALAVRRKVWSITEELQPSRLPVAFGNAEPPSPVDPSNDQRLFVRQLRALDVQVDRVRRAILVYYRAFEQRSFWLRHDLLIDDEIEVYERRLIDEWAAVRLRLEDEILPTDRDEEHYLSVGRRILGWMETEANFPVRSNIADRFIMRGSFHILANERTPRVYWHPKFIENLERILSA